MLRGLYEQSRPMNFGGEIIWGRSSRYTTQSPDPISIEIWVELFRLGKPPKRIQLFFPVELEREYSQKAGEYKLMVQDWFATRAKKVFPEDTLYIRFFERTFVRIVWPDTNLAEILYGEFRDPSPNMWLNAQLVTSEEGNLRDRLGTVHQVDMSAHCNILVS